MKVMGCMNLSHWNLHPKCLEKTETPDSYSIVSMRRSTDSRQARCLKRHMCLELVIDKMKRGICRAVPFPLLCGVGEYFVPLVMDDDIAAFASTPRRRAAMRHGWRRGRVSWAAIGRREISRDKGAGVKSEPPAWSSPGSVDS